MNANKSFLIERFDEIGSTNTYLKEKRADGQNRIAVALCQTGGRGTKGRSFSSARGGVYLSKLTFYDDLPVAKAFSIMASTAVAVCKTLVFYGIQPVIKWPNDIFVNDKKICGILIENVFSGSKISSSIVGVGLNVVNTLPEELHEIATTMRLSSGKEFSVSEVTEKLIDELQRDYSIDEYISFVGYMGTSAELLIGDERVHGRLLSVDETGGLWVEIQGEERRLTSAEVSVRICR
jgi:BirA family biotin operon repressor/biotin-[acetyl-CoA-carboxylase] ligase